MNTQTDTGLPEKKVRIVVIITAAAMVIEITAGFLTKSMALLADGWHMASHVFAIGLSWAAYVISRKYSESRKFSFSREKTLAFAGYTSAVVLLFVAALMAFESVKRLFDPVNIRFNEALAVAAGGLIVNVVCAIILFRKPGTADFNMRAAYLHVLADSLTSVTAIGALIAAKLFSIMWFDPLSGLLSSVIITKWAFDLIRGTVLELVDFKKK